VFDKIPQRVSSMPRGQVLTSRSFRTQAMVARPPFESRKLILDTTFAVEEDFSKDDATKWAVQELKHRGLKRLFKPVAFTTYERLVWSFYENLKYNYNRPDVLVSSIDDMDVEVTIADIAAVLKCHHEPPKVDEPWIDCPSMLTIEDIVSDMCEGQYADMHKNVASKAKNVCPLGHKTQRRDMFLSALYSFHRGFWCSIPKIIWRQIYKFWEGVYHRVVVPTRTWGLPFPFLITHMLRKKGTEAMRLMGQSLNIHASAESSGTRADPTCLES
jgi:hypothetical protein